VGSILASAVLCGCPSENIPLSDREREAPRASKANGEERPVSERVEGFHRTMSNAVTQTPGDEIVTVYLTPPQPPALLGLRPALLVHRQSKL